MNVAPKLGKSVDGGGRSRDDPVSRGSLIPAGDDVTLVRCDIIDVIIMIIVVTIFAFIVYYNNTERTAASSVPDAKFNWISVTAAGRRIERQIRGGDGLEVDKVAECSSALFARE